MTSLAGYQAAFRTWKADPINSFPSQPFVRYGGFLLIFLFAIADSTTTLIATAYVGPAHEVNPLVRYFLANGQYGLFLLFKLSGAVLIWVLFTMQNLCLENRREEILFYLFIAGVNLGYLLVNALNVYAIAISI